jgi:putative endopeptidase
MEPDRSRESDSYACILRDMNLHDEVTSAINPGDDFYSYVNQKWCDAHPIPADRSRVSTLVDLDERVTEQLHELLEKPIVGNEARNQLLAKRLYASGMDEAAIEAHGLSPVLPFIRTIEDITSIDDIKRLIMSYHSDGRALIWRLGLGVDEKDSQRYVMEISQSGLLLPNRDYYFEKGKDFEKIRTAYKKYLAQLFDLLGKDNAAGRVENVYAIEEKLATVSNTSTENRDAEALYNPFTFAQLQEKFSSFDWDAYRQQTGLEEFDVLIVHQPKFLHEILHLVEVETAEAWRDYLIAHVLSRYMPYLGKKCDDMHFAFFGTVLTGVEKQKDRYKRVIANVSSLLPEPIGKLYVDEYFDGTAKAAITDLVTHVQNALRQRIENLDWMSSRTKQKAFEKLDTFMPLLGYPDTWRSYESLKLQDNYLADILLIREFEWRYDVSRATKPVDHREWLMSPATVNAYYWPNTNGITFPAAILQSPMFDAKGDFAANYGAIGMVIGHEMIHGFDDSGSKYDKVGNLKSWWKENDRKAFEERVQRLVTQYNAYEVIDGNHVKGKLTLGENIADLGGMLIAYDALQQKLKESGETDALDGFTPKQRFFLAQARIWRTNIRPELTLQFLVKDPHSPAYLRVNGVVTNVDAWYDAWRVRDTNALYKPSSKRVRIW